MRWHPFEPGRPWLLTLLWMVLGVYLAFILILWLLQEVLLFPGVWLLREVDAEGPGWGEVVQIRRPDGSTFPLRLQDNGHDRLVLLAHGNGEAALDMGDYARVLTEAGWDFAAVEYRGYAGVSGWPTERRLQADLLTTIETLRTRGVTADRLVLFGRSIGGGVAASALDEVVPAGLVLESSFDSLLNTAADRSFLTLTPIGWLLRSPFRTASRVHRTGVPVFQVHDTTDHVVSVERARAVSAGIYVETTGFPHGAPLLLLDPSLREHWLQWLEARVPRR